MVVSPSPFVAPQHATHAFVVLASEHLTRVESELLYRELVNEITRSAGQWLDARTALLRLLKIIRTSTGTVLSRWEALNLAEQAALDVAEARRDHGHC